MFSGVLTVSLKPYLPDLEMEMESYAVFLVYTTYLQVHSYLPLPILPFLSNTAFLVPNALL